jgi:tetratricopeptide (TPR) repeat protein
MDRESLVQQYFARLESNPHDLLAVWELEQLFSEEEKGQLVGMFKDAAPEQASPEGAARLYLEAGRIAGSLGKDDLGKALLARASQIGAETLLVPEVKLQTFAIEQAWEEAFDFFGQAVEQVEDPSVTSRMYLRMGNILEDVLQDAAEADNAYNYAFELDQTNILALRYRQSLARQQEEWLRLAEVLYQEASVGEDAERQMDLMLDLGDVYLHHLERAEDAAQCYVSVYEFDPANARAREALTSLGYEVPELDEESQAEELDVEAVEPVSEAEEDLEAAELEAVEPEEDAEEDYADEGPDVDGEATEAGIELEPADDEVAEEEDLDASETPVDDEEDVDELELVESVETEDGEADGSEEAESDESEELEEDIDELEIDELDGEELEDDEHEDGEEVAEESEEADESEVDDSEQGSAEGEHDDDGDDLWLTRFQALVETASTSSGEEALQSLVRAARLEARHRDGDALSLRMWREAVAQDFAEDFHARTHFLFDSESFWESALEETDSSGLKARIAFVNLHDKARAAELAEGDESIAQLLEDQEAGEKNWRKFQRELEGRYDDLGDDEKAYAVYWRMADISAANEDVDKEMDALRRLDRQVDSDGRVKSRLKRVYAKAEKWPMYVDIIKKEVESLGEDDPAEKIDLLKEMVVVYRDEMQHDMMVVNTYKDILALDESNIEAIDALIGLYEKLNRSSELVSMLQQKAEMVKKPARKVEIYSQIAQLFLEKFRNQAEAIKAYESVLEIDAYHPEALAFLKEMYEKRRDWEKLIDVHKREIETYETDEEKAAGLKEVAQLASDRLRNNEIATELWLEVREFAPQDPDALDALESLYEKTKAYDELGDILDQKADITSDPEEQMKLYQKMGMLYSDRLENPEKAIGAWQKALALQPDDLKARKALERLYIDNKLWDELEGFYEESDAYEPSDLVRLLETLAGTVKEDDVKIELLLRAARNWREKLEDTGRAERDLERVLGIDERNAAAALQLEPIYVEAEEYAKLKDVYEIILEHREDAEERREYQLKLAELHEGHLGDVATSFGWYAQAFLSTPETDDLMELERTARASDQWAQLVNVYQSALQQEIDEGTHRRLRLRLGRVLSEELERLDEALAQFQSVLDEDDENLHALAAMEDIYERAERWDELMQVYERRIELTDAPEDRVKILHGMAMIAEEQTGDIESAIEKYQAALEIDERYEPSLGALHRLYAGRQEYESLADVIRREIAIIEDRADARSEAPVSIVDAMGLIQSGGADVEAVAEPESVEDEAAELEVLEPVDDGEFESGADELDEESEELEFETADAEDSEVEDDVDEADASSEVSDDDEFEDEPFVVEDEEDAAAHAASHDGPIYLEDEIERLVGLRYELGIVCKEFLGEDEEAVTSLGRVLAWRPTHADALSAIESYLDSAEFRHRVAVILEPVYDVRGAWDDLIRVLGLQVDHADEDAEKVRLLERMGDIHVEEKGEPAAAFRAYARILPLEPGHERARAQMERIAESLGNWQEVVDHYVDALEHVEDGELEKSYFFALGDIYADYLDDAEQAQEWFEKVLSSEPTSARALDELEGLLLREEKWTQLHEVLEKKLELAESEEDVRERRLRIALLFEEKLDDRGKAIEIYGDILADHPEDLGALRAMNRLYRTEGRWEELASNLETELELAPEGEKNDVKNRLAGVLHAHLGEWNRAVDLYEEVLGLEPTNVAALSSMEELMYADDAPNGRISRILEPLYLQEDNWSALISALEVQADTAETSDERVELLHRIATLHETRGESMADAFQTYALALLADVENEATLQNLYRLAQATGDYEYLVEVFEFTAAENDDAMVKRDMLRRAAAVLRDTIVDTERATERLHQVLEYVPDDLETVNELQAIYERDSDWGNLVDILVKKAELVEQPAEQIQLLKQSATMYEEFLEDPLQAIESYNRVLAIDDADAHAIDRLEVLYREQEMWDDLLSTFSRKVELAENDEARKDLFYAMGMIYREELTQPHDAIDTFRNILEIDTNELAAWQHLDELFQETEQWSELLTALEAQLSLTQVPEDWYTLKYRIGRLYETELFDVPEAIGVYAEILENDGSHGPTTEALEGLIERGDHEAQAAEVLVPIYQQAGEWEKLIHINRLLIDATEDPERRLELYNQVGQIQEHRIGDLEAAFDTFVAAFGAEPARSETLDTLERIAAQLDAWHTLIERLDDKLEDMTDFGAVRNVLVRIARIYEQETLEAGQAIDRFNRVLEIEPDDDVAIQALDRLYQREGRWEDLAEILRTRVLNSTEPEETLELRLRLGQLFQTALEDAQSALETYQEILLNDPENPQAIQSLEQMFMSGQAVTQVAAILEPFYSERGQHEKLVEIYVQRLEQIDEPEERYDVWILIANTFLQELEDKESAIVAYGRALAERPDESQLIEEIERIAEETGAWGQAAELYADALEQGRAEPEDQVPIYLALARIFDKRLGMMDEAEQSYLAALQLDEGQPDALEALDRIYENQARWADLASVIRRRIEGLYDEEQIVDLNFRLAQLFQTQLMDLDQAVDTYRTILDIQPIHGPSLKMLERIFYERQQWDELFDILERESEITEDPDERANFYAQMAQLAEEALDRKMEAVDLWNRVLQMREDDLNALRQLRRLYVDDERWSDLVNVLEREVELTEDPAERLQLYQALGQLWGDQLANEGQALDSWQNVLEIDPHHLPALRALRRLYENQSDYVELSNVIYRLLDHDGVEPDQKLELWTQQGQIQAEMLMQPERSIEAWKNVLSYDPGNQQALEQLEQQFLQESRWEEAAEVLEMKLDYVDDEYDKIDLLVRIADIWETKIMDRDRAAQFYEYILEVDPTNTQAGASLEAIYREQGTPEAFQKLATLYLDRSDQMADDISAFLDARRQSANIFEVELQHPDGAFLVLLTAFTPDTLDDEQLIADLERLARETGQWAELVAKLEEVLQQVGDALEAAELHKMAGKWQAEELGLPDDAVYHLQRALSIEPDNIDVMDNLERLYREIAAWPELSQILHQRVELTMDPDEQSDIWRKLGELYEMQMGQIDEAIQAYSNILQIDPSDILAIESLERIYEAYDRWQELVNILRQKAESTYDPDEIIQIRFRIAQIQEDRLESVQDAIATYREILAVDQTHMQSLKELERLFMATSDWNSLAEVYEQQIQLTHEPDEQLQVYGRQASLYENQFEDIDGAV